MQLYRLKRDDADHDEFAEYLIRAESEQQAREMAAEHTLRNSGSSTGKLMAREWLHSRISSCEVISVEGEPEILMDVFWPG